jgi:hypothetical protein
MDWIDIIGYIGVASLILLILPVDKQKKLLLIMGTLIILLVYSVLKPIYPVGVLMIVLMLIVIKEIRKTFKTKSTIKLVEVEYDNTYITEFIKNYRKDIYSFFPFYVPHRSQKCFLIMRDMNLAGIFVANVTGDILTIEVDYLKPMYRDNYIGNYIFNQNPGFFKRMGINKLVGKSFHSGHSKFLKKMGFTQTFIDDQLFYVKNIE